jgi:hypothetical protein
VIIAAAIKSNGAFHHLICSGFGIHYQLFGVPSNKWHMKLSDANGVLLVALKEFRETASLAARIVGQSFFRTF